MALYLAGFIHKCGDMIYLAHYASGKWDPFLILYSICRKVRFDKTWFNIVRSVGSSYGSQFQVDGQHIKKVETVQTATSTKGMLI